MLVASAGGARGIVWVVCGCLTAGAVCCHIAPNSVNTWLGLVIGRQ